MNLRWLLTALWMMAAVASADVVDSALGQSVERHLSPDVELQEWTKDAERLAQQAGDRVETREVAITQAETVKLNDVVPPIYFDSGVARVPASTVEELRQVMDKMRHQDNVRLNLVGHADNQPLSAVLQEQYGSNEGLSRERAGEVAEFFQNALDLPPEAIAYEWAGDSSPVASNATVEGRALNRRVEVEVWYDEQTDAVAEREFVVSDDVRTVKVCRMETVCKLRYLDGHDRRARIKNLVAPFHYQDADLAVSQAFLSQIDEVLKNLSDRQNVVVKFVGHTDSAPLTERESRIYGDHLSLSRARAHRVALKVQEILSLPGDVVVSDGFGADRSVAPNSTERGRALNRRIEVEFWYDDVLQELPDEPQLCPADAGSEMVTLTFEPPWGPLPEISLTGGQAVLTEQQLAQFARGLEAVADKTNPRLRFVGYTANERLDRRTARIYGDDVGLSAARARRAMEKVQTELALNNWQVEYQGRGYLHSKDVINAGFTQGENSFVEVQVVYDESALVDDYEGIDVAPLTRELSPQNPFALNMMRITVDGEPIDDPQRSSADVQRCTDVAMHAEDIQFSFDSLSAEPRLEVTSDVQVLEVDASASNDGRTASLVAPVNFRMYTNYQAFIKGAEVRIFPAGDSTRSSPIVILPIAPGSDAQWNPETVAFRGPVDEYFYVLRAYDDAGRFDETQPKRLWMTYATADAAETELEPTSESVTEPATRSVSVLDSGYGEDSLAIKNIPMGTGTVTVQGRGLAADSEVWVAGQVVPVDASGNFVSEVLLPDGGHTVEVALLDEEGLGDLYLRDLDLKQTDWFYAGLADLTWSEGSSSDNAELYVGRKATQTFDSTLEGRLALYASGKFSSGWGLTTAIDTREDELDNLFSNVVDKRPDALFRRLDPDYHYPTFGDDSTVTELAPSQGGLFLQVDKDDSHAMWGNYTVAYMNNELAQVDRGLYGAKGHYESASVTNFGEKRFVADAFGAEPGTVASRQDFLGTGGSFYYLRHRDILMGSERIRIEVRDKVSGMVTGVVNLNASTDYDIDYLQGTVLLNEPLSAIVDDNLLVRTGGDSGDEAYLVVRYEYTPGFDDIDSLAAGGQISYWVNDHLKFGLMANENQQDDGDADSSLKAADVTLRMTAGSWMKFQAGRSEGLLAQSFVSADGGYEFENPGAPLLRDAQADAYRVDLSVELQEFSERLDGRFTLYGQSLEAGYSAPGLETFFDTEGYGGTLDLDLTSFLALRGKSDVLNRDDSVSTTAHEVNLSYQFAPKWNVSAGLRHDDRTDDSLVSTAVQETGSRTDAVVQVGYDALGNWNSYGFVQDSIETSGTRESNARFGVGGGYMISDRLRMDMEVSDGDMGSGGRIGTSYMQSERTSFYLNYALENERTDNGLGSSSNRQGNLVSGMKTRLSDSASVFVEERYQHSRSLSGLTHATGVQLAATDRWTIALNSDIGTLQNRTTGADTDRVAGGLNIGFGTETLQFSTAVEYRDDESEQLDASAIERTTWLSRNSLRWQINPASRLLGKFNYSVSDSSEGDFYDGEYTEAVVGYAFRPVKHDRLNALVKYTYYYDLPAAGQVTQSNSFTGVVQRSHVASVDLNYELTRRLSIGGKYAHRIGEISLDRDDVDFFDNTASLFVLRSDLRFLENWELLIEGRALEMDDLGETRAGALLAVSRYFGDHFKVGTGYNFTDFSDDLTDLDYDHHGMFFNLTGAF